MLNSGAKDFHLSYHLCAQSVSCIWEDSPFCVTKAALLERRTTPKDTSRQWHVLIWPNAPGLCRGTDGFPSISAPTCRRRSAAFALSETAESELHWCDQNRSIQIGNWSRLKFFVSKLATSGWSISLTSAPSQKLSLQDVQYIYLLFFYHTLWCQEPHDKLMPGRRKRAEREEKTGIYVSVASVCVYVPTPHGLYLMPRETFYQARRMPAPAGYGRAYTAWFRLSCWFKLLSITHQRNLQNLACSNYCTISGCCLLPLNTWSLQAQLAVSFYISL